MPPLPCLAQPTGGCPVIVGVWVGNLCRLFIDQHNESAVAALLVVPVTRSASVVVEHSVATATLRTGRGVAPVPRKGRFYGD
jgi:hypothetical protein